MDHKQGIKHASFSQSSVELDKQFCTILSVLSKEWLETDEWSGWEDQKKKDNNDDFITHARAFYYKNVFPFNVGIFNLIAKLSIFIMISEHNRHTTSFLTFWHRFNVHTTSQRRSVKQLKQFFEIFAWSRRIESLSTVNGFIYSIGP